MNYNTNYFAEIHGDELKDVNGGNIFNVFGGVLRIVGGLVTMGTGIGVLIKTKGLGAPVAKKKISAGLATIAGGGSAIHGALSFAR